MDIMVIYSALRYNNYQICVHFLAERDGLIRKKETKLYLTANRRPVFLHRKIAFPENVCVTLIFKSMTLKKSSVSCGYGNE